MYPLQLVSLEFRACERKNTNLVYRYQLHFLGPGELDLQRLYQEKLLCLVDKIQR
jgi:hypothetical protein